MLGTHSALNEGSAFDRRDSPRVSGALPHRVHAVIADRHPSFQSARVSFGVGAERVELFIESTPSISHALELVLRDGPRYLVVDAELAGDFHALADSVRRVSPSTRVIDASNGVAAPPRDGALDPRVEAVAVRALLNLRDGLSSATHASARRANAAGARGGEVKAGTLTTREREVLRLVALGNGKKSVAHQLGLSVHTVNRHVTSLMGKLDIHDRVELARFALREGFVEP